MQEACIQQKELSSTLHLTLDHFQCGNLSFYLSTTPLACECRFDRLVVLVESSSKTFQLVRLAAASRIAPTIKCFGLPPGTDLPELLLSHLSHFFAVGRKQYNDQTNACCL